MYNNIIKSIKHWLNKSDGGEWFEPYVTNKDITIKKKIIIKLKFTSNANC